MHSSGPVLLGMGAYIACISAEIVLEVPATLKLMQKVRVKVKHDVQQFLIVFGSILVLAKFNCDQIIWLRVWQSFAKDWKRKLRFELFELAKQYVCVVYRQDPNQDKKKVDWRLR